MNIWELGIKRALGKLEAPPNPGAALGESGFAELAIMARHAEAAAALPPLHRDPFDRMLVAQAQLEGLTLVTSDAQLSAYGVAVFAA